MTVATAKEQAEGLAASLAEIGKTLQSATGILARENPEYEALFAMQKALTYSQGQLAHANRDFSAMVEAVGELAHRQKRLQYNLIPYAKSITYRALHKDDAREMECDGAACHVVSGDVPLMGTNGFSVKMASDTSEMAFTRTAALSNLVIEVNRGDEMRLNNFGLVSKGQLEKMDRIISILEQLGKRSPKTPEEVFAKTFVKPFKTKYMEDASDIRQGKMTKGAKLACQALHERFADKLSAAQYGKLARLAQSLSPVAIGGMWQEQDLAR